MEIYCLDKNVYFFITFCIRSSGRNYRYLMNETNLTNCALDFLGENTWPSQNYATWAHSDNTFANSTPNSTQSAVECHFEPLIIDHIFWRTKNPKNVNVRTTGFKVLQWKTSCNSMRGEEEEEEEEQEEKEEEEKEDEEEEEDEKEKGKGTEISQDRGQLFLILDFIGAIIISWNKFWRL